MDDEFSERILITSHDDDYFESFSHEPRRSQHYRQKSDRHDDNTQYEKKRRRDDFHEQDTRRNIDREQLPEMFSIHKGKVSDKKLVQVCNDIIIIFIKVKSIQDYGIFVEMNGIYKHGLVHISQISKQKLWGKHG
jgi:ribosomal protein S1